VFYEELVHYEFYAILNLGCIFIRLLKKKEHELFIQGSAMVLAVHHSMDELNGGGVVN
jgi:hypothetical protein